MARVKAKAEPATLADQMKKSGDRMAQMAAVTASFSGPRPAFEVLRKVRAVPTIFPFIDLQTKVGGWPIERPTLIHGPSNNGKSSLAMGLGKSFLEMDHFCHWIDAEYTTDKRWLRMMKMPNHPGFTALRPKSYEHAVESVHEWATKIDKARTEGKLPEDTSGICVVDSINQLAPEDLMKELFKATKADEVEIGKKGIDGAGGRAGQILAKINNAWMKILVPLMGTTGLSIVIITRENENTDKSPWAEEFVVTGGKGVNFDSSMTVRVLRASFITHGEGQNKETYGERHKMIIRKTKVARKEEKHPTAYFNTSNGVLVPPGFDTPRDYLETAIEVGLVEQNGSFFVFEGERIGQGAHNVVKMLYGNEKFFFRFKAKVREKIMEIVAAEPGESDD